MKLVNRTIVLQERIKPCEFRIPSDGYWENNYIFVFCVVGTEACLSDIFLRGCGFKIENFWRSTVAVLQNVKDGKMID